MDTASVLPDNFMLLSVEEISRLINRYSEDRMREDWEKNMNNRSGKTINSYWATGWFPFASAESTKLLIDINPGDQGTAGQIIVIGNSVDQPEVIAKNPAEFFGQIEYGLSNDFYYVDSVWEVMRTNGIPWSHY